jgi:heme/copper-type cytochrome/quinol oxidase subunit 4
MNEPLTSVESLIAATEKYGKTSATLLRLQATRKVADVISSFVATTAVVVLLCMVFLFLHLAIALWLGEVTGKMYYGFLIVAGFYALVALLASLYFKNNHNNAIKNHIIDQLVD